MNPINLDEPAELLTWEQTVGVRLNSLDLIRACEQTAIVMSGFQGRGVNTKQERKRNPKLDDIEGRRSVKRSKTSISEERARTYGRRSMLGYLLNAEFEGRIVQHDVIQGKRSNSAGQWPGPERKIGRLRADRLPGDPRVWQFDFVAVPLEGVNDLLHGCHGGSISFLLGGTRDAFLPQFDAEKLSDPHRTGHYLVVVEGPRRPFSERREFSSAHDRILRINSNVLHRLATETSIADVLNALILVSSARSGREYGPLTIGTMSPRLLEASKHYTKGLRQYLASFARTHAFLGSSVAAALAVLQDDKGIGAFIGIASRAEATAIAVCAMALEGQFEAIPVVPEFAAKSRGLTGCLIQPRSSLLYVQDFVKDPYSFAIVTGVTENLAVRGVRYLPAGHVSTHTVLLRGGTRTSRSIVNDHSLTSKEVHMCEPQNESVTKRRYTDVLEDLFKRRDEPLLWPQ